MHAKKTTPILENSPSNSDYILVKRVSKLDDPYQAADSDDSYYDAESKLDPYQAALPNSNIPY